MLQLSALLSKMLSQSDVNVWQKYLGSLTDKIFQGQVICDQLYNVICFTSD
uniref:Uncharacterized protein n=1 Tax=Anguilla anguilla TaxID=7936 RepID=A0A0E9PTP9_ANGAN